MSILITGSNGFLGSHLVNALQGRDLSLLDRRASKHPPRFRFQMKEINGESDYSSALSHCQTVIHCAARVHVMDDKSKDPLSAYRETNLNGTLNLAKQAVKAGVKRFIFISSIKVNGESSHPKCPFRFDDSHKFEDFYGQSKSEAEIALEKLSRHSGLELVIIRPTLVYGVGVKGNFASLMALVNKGLPLPFGAISQNKRSLVSVHNLVDLIVTCIDHPRAVNQVFLVSDDHDISTKEMVDYMARALGKRACQLPVPLGIFKVVGRMFGKMSVIERLIGSLKVDISHTKETLNWTPPQTLEDGFNEAASSLLKPGGRK